ncbi:hypothetical protein I2I11_03245 [Pontibacter sp. 172403-2]|uniref:hypothetical protein n=1 Tax=Pontibacter rufus TaxID=2791028 RepID=UPI0018AFF00C|nr:hypothetical protein [Pontibacter sp. 172403-2]MBF9252298.1 hypothetical protein [Pontibacter sp. 172403-2]
MRTASTDEGNSNGVYHRVQRLAHTCRHVLLAGNTAKLPRKRLIADDTQAELKRVEERKSGVAYKIPYLYSFDTEQYECALQEGW